MQFVVSVLLFMDLPELFMITYYMKKFVLQYLKIPLSPMYTGTLAKYTENYALILHLIKLNPVYMYPMPYTVIEAKESP